MKDNKKFLIALITFIVITTALVVAVVFQIVEIRELTDTVNDLKGLANIY